MRPYRCALCRYRTTGKFKPEYLCPRCGGFKWKPVRRKSWADQMVKKAKERKP